MVYTSPSNVWTEEQFTEMMGKLVADGDVPGEVFEHQVSMDVMRSIVLRSLLHQAVPAGNA